MIDTHPYTDNCDFSLNKYDDDPGKYNILHIIEQIQLSFPVNRY